MTQQHKERAAMAALELVKDGMVLGLGTGSTAAFFISGLGDKVRQGLDIKGIPTSEESAEAARAAGIELITPDETTIIDLDVDGADEIDPHGYLIKGGGAALLREKIIARAAREFVVIADASKDVAQLGKFPLPIEIESFSPALTVRAVREALAGLGYENVPLDLRPREEGGFVITDGGNLVLDARLGRITDAPALEKALVMIPGVVDCGLFIGLATRIILGTDQGVETRNV